ncbi:MAG: MGMT family protein [Bacteroidetes Order II. Incertae sedis bacterium]|nr:MGMT family protein [Bacteroidetes Order II. bacterium]
MPTSDFYERVYAVARQVPFGNVTTYGHIARYLGTGQSARAVGWALNQCPPDVPAHRVVNRFGGLSGALHFGGPFVMEDRLRSEGIHFTAEGLVLMARHLWDPTMHLDPPTLTHLSNKTDE